MTAPSAGEPSRTLGRPGSARQGLPVDLLSLAALLALLIAANREWLFSGIRWLDTWMYLGYFQHYDFAAMLADNKKIARLPWILLGYVVDQATSAVVAQYVLHIGLLAAGAAALYIVLRREFGRSVAVIASALYLTYIPAHGNGGWDYHNTLAGPLYILTYGSLLRLTDEPADPLKKGLAAGLLGAALIHTNIIFVLVAPALVVLALVRIGDQLHRKSLRAWLNRALVAIAAGGIGLTLIFCIVDALVGRPFFFFLRLVNRSAELVANPDYESAWWRPWSGAWWYNGYHAPLILTVLALALLVGLLSLGRRANISRADKRHVGVFVGSLLLFVVGQSMGHPLLEPYYMAFPLLLPAVFALAALIHTLLTGRDAPAGPHWNGAASVIACAAFGGLFVMLSMHPAAWHFGSLKPYDGLLALAPFLVAFAVAWVLMRIAAPPAKWAALVGSALLVLALAYTNGEWPSDPTYRLAYNADNPCRTRQATFSMVIQADHLLFPLFKAGSDVPIVYRTGDMLKIGTCNLLLEEVARPIGGLGYGTPMQYWKMETVPELPDDVVNEASQKQKILAVVSKDEAYMDRLLGRLRQRNDAWHVARRAELTDGPTAVKFTILSRLP